jgi:hypothetical protein
MATPMAVASGSCVTPMANGSVPPAVGARPGGGNPPLSGWRPGSASLGRGPPGRTGPGSTGGTPADQGIAAGGNAAPRRGGLWPGAGNGAVDGTPGTAVKPAKRKVGFGSRLNFAASTGRWVCEVHTATMGVAGLHSTQRLSKSELVLSIIALADQEQGQGYGGSTAGRPS